jgi:hypothetical protein
MPGREDRWKHQGISELRRLVALFKVFNTRHAVTLLDRSVNGVCARLARSQVEARLSDLSRPDNRTQPGVSRPEEGAKDIFDRG